MKVNCIIMDVSVLVDCIDELGSPLLVATILWMKEIISLALRWASNVPAESQESFR